MVEFPSRFDEMKAEAFQTAADKIVEDLVIHGVARPRAMEFVENEVTLLYLPKSGMKIIAKWGDILSPGSSDEALTYFARQLHGHCYSELGGKPGKLPKKPVPEGDIVRAEQKKEAAEAKQRQAEFLAEHRRQLEKDRVAKLPNHVEMVSDYL